MHPQQQILEQQHGTRRNRSRLPGQRHDVVPHDFSCTVFGICINVKEIFVTELKIGGAEQPRQGRGTPEIDRSWKKTAFRRA